MKSWYVPLPATIKEEELNTRPTLFSAVHSYTPLSDVRASRMVSSFSCVRNILRSSWYVLLIFFHVIRGSGIPIDGHRMVRDIPRTIVIAPPTLAWMFRVLDQTMMEMLVRFDWMTGGSKWGRIIIKEMKYSTSDKNFGEIIKDQINF